MNDDFRQLLANSITANRDRIWQRIKKYLHRERSDETSDRLMHIAMLMHKHAGKFDIAIPGDYQLKGGVSAIEIPHAMALNLNYMAEYFLDRDDFEWSLFCLMSAAEHLGRTMFEADADIEAVAKEARISVAMLGVRAKLERDPKQAAKAKAKELWRDWQAGRTLHKCQAAFARYVVQCLPVIESTESVNRWVREWRAEAGQ